MEKTQLKQEIEMETPDGLIEITENHDPGYHPLMHFQDWRVAVYNENPGMTAEAPQYLEYHALTDEVFMLLKGQCTLLVAGGERPAGIRAVRMEPLKCYNIRKGVWHNLTLSGGGSIAIVENHSTSRENSAYHTLTEDDRQAIRKLLRNGAESPSDSQQNL